MTTKAANGFFARLTGLFRGLFGSRLERAEAANAEAVYHTAIRGQRHHRDEIRSALGKLIYLRNKTDAELTRTLDDLAVVERALKEAALEDYDERALLLLEKRDALKVSVERSRADFDRFGVHVADAKRAVSEIDESIRSLTAERDEMLARKSHAEARRDVQAVLEGVSTSRSAHVEALENVRESIARLEVEAGLGSMDDRSAGLSMAELRREERKHRNKEALEALKMELKGKMLPAPSSGLDRNELHQQEVAREMQVEIA